MFIKYYSIISCHQSYFHSNTFIHHKNRQNLIVLQQFIKQLNGLVQHAETRHDKNSYRHLIPRCHTNVFMDKHTFK